MPLVPAIAFLNVKNPLIFSATWGILIFVWLLIWLVLPCNPNLNCTATTPRGKDGTKAFVASFLIVYGILVGVAFSARFFICTDGRDKPNAYGGGILTNVKSLFTMDKVPKPGAQLPSPSYSLSVSPHSISNDLNNSFASISRNLQQYPLSFTSKSS